MLLMIHLIPVGMATPYTATTTNTDNSLSSEFFTVGLYSDESCTTPASTFFKSSEEYNKVVESNTTYSINDGTDLAADNLFLKIIASNHTDGNYSVTCVCTCTFVSSDQQKSASNPSLTVVLKNGGNTVTTPVSGTGYKVSLLTSGFSAVMTSAPTSMSVSMRITITDNISGAYVGPSQSVSISQSSSVVITDDTTAAEAIENANPGDTLSYAGSSSEGKSSGKSYTGGYGVTVGSGNDATISDNGKVDASLNCIDAPFVIVLSKGDQGNPSGTVIVSVDGKSSYVDVDRGYMSIVYKKNNSITFLRLETPIR